MSGESWQHAIYLSCSGMNTLEKWKSALRGNRPRLVWLLLIVLATVAATLVFSEFCWFKRNEHVALWLEGVALVLIFIWDRIDSNLQHEQTIKQLTATQDQANAALIAAKAAKQSADLTVEIQRPHVGILNIITGGEQQYFNTTLAVRNFGPLAAVDVIVTFEYLVENVSSLSHTEPSTLQIFPGDLSHVTSQFVADPADAGPIRAGQRRLKENVSILYKTYDGRQFEYKAELTYVHTNAQMKMQRSGTSQTH